jgi:hypothetical protein
MANTNTHVLDRTELTAIEQVALTKFKADKGARGDALPGSYEGTLDLRVKYAVNVGEDYVGTHAASVPWQRMCAVLLSKVNDATIASVLREALEGDVDESEIKTEAQLAINLILGTTEKEFKGKVTGSAVVLRASTVS